MDQQPQDKKNGNLQRNINSILLTVAIGLFGWLLYSVNDLDSKVSGMMPLINENSSAVQGINTVQNKQEEKIEELNKQQSERIEDILNRLVKIETIQADHSRK